jgi:hypothetical protein
MQRSGLVRGPWIWWPALVAVVVAGCSDPNRPYPVSGTVIFENGEPAREAAGGTITFNSAELKKSSVGEIQPDGTFRLTTTRKDDGAPPGRYKVTVMNPLPPDNPGQPAPKRVIDRRYESLQTTDLEETVQPKSNDILLKVKRAGIAKK